MSRRRERLRWIDEQGGSHFRDLTGRDLDGVLRFLPVFEHPDFTPGKWVGGDGAWPFVDYDARVTSFHRALYENGFVVVFSWPEWQLEAIRLMEDEAALEQADLLSLRKLLTTHARKERFCDGHFLSMLEDGHLVAVLRRLRQLREGMEG